MEKFQIEYNMNVSARILFTRLSTASGLAEWFADEVYINNSIYTFVWSGIPQKAEITQKRNNELIRFRWLDGSDQGNFFQFKLQEDELTKELALIITDFAEPEDVEDARSLWNSQVNALKHKLGV